MQKSRNLKLLSQVNSSLSPVPETSVTSVHESSLKSSFSINSSGYHTDQTPPPIERSDSSSSNISVKSACVTNAVSNKTELDELLKKADIIEPPKDAAKRASEVYKHLPKQNIKMRCGVMLHTFNRLLKSPKSKVTFASMLKGSRRFSEVCSATLGASKVSEKLAKQLAVETRLLTRLRAQKKWDKIRKLLFNWRLQGFTLSHIAEVTHMSLSSLRWHLKEPVGNNRRKISEQDKENCIEFFTRNSITMRLPFKRHAHKLYFRSAMKKPYALYKAEMQRRGERVLSLSSVHRLLPRKLFCPANTVPFHQCLCNQCENTRLCLLAAIHHGVKGVSRSTNATCLSSMCPAEQSAEESSEEGHEIFRYKRNCLWRQCKDCAHKFARDLAAANPDLDLAKEVTWHQWEGVYKMIGGQKTKVAFNKFRKTGPLGELIDLLKLHMVSMPKHVFVYQWQAHQFEVCGKSLKDSEVAMVMDFAKNIQFERQREVQGAYWYRRSVMLHPVVCYFLCPNGCGRTVTDEVMCVTNDLSHDAHAVAAFEQQALNHLNQRGIHPNKLIQFTDNCASQYKCFTSFGYMTHAKHKIERHYFGEGHGKGPGDASVGRTKRLVDRASRSDEPVGDVQDAASLVRYCRQNLATPDTGDNMCCHFQRHFYHVPQIQRSYKCEFKTLPGTKQYHCVQNTSTVGNLIAREISCFCR